MKDTWDDWEDDDERWELTEEALKAEGLTDKLVNRFVFLDREEVFDLITGDDDETDVDTGTE